MYDTIIVGGGISGLYCAIHLTNVLVLEESNEWGGKIKNITIQNMKEPVDSIKITNFYGI